MVAPLASRQDTVDSGVVYFGEHREMGAKKAISWPTGAQEHSGEDPCFGRRGLAKDTVRRNQGGSRNQEVFQWRGRACQRRKDQNRLGHFGYRISEQCALLATGEKMLHSSVYSLREPCFRKSCLLFIF